MANVTTRQAQIARRKKIRTLEAARDRAIENRDKAVAALKKSRDELAAARKA